MFNIGTGWRHDSGGAISDEPAASGLVPGTARPLLHLGVTEAFPFGATDGNTRLPLGGSFSPFLPDSDQSYRMKIGVAMMELRAAGDIHQLRGQPATGPSTWCQLYRFGVEMDGMQCCYWLIPTRLARIVRTRVRVAVPSPALYHTSLR
jgi:hypothetical protein